jgi:hypothetical protein
VPELRIIFRFSFAGIASYRFVIAFFFILPRRCYLSEAQSRLRSSPIFRKRVLSSNSHHFNDKLASPKSLFDGTRVVLE